MAVISSSTSPLPGAVTHPSPSVGGDGRGRVGMGGGKGGRSCRTRRRTILKPQYLYVHNVIEWYRNVIQRMHAYQWQQHGRRLGRVDRTGSLYLDVQMAGWTV